LWKTGAYLLGGVGAGYDGWHVIEIQGVLVSQQNARWLIDHLRAVGRADDVTAAWAIEQALEDHLVVPQLEPDESDALLTGLTDAPAGLSGLRGKLARDRRNRLV
jgi:hypothetical protein